jgi:hypothetical protein
MGMKIEVARDALRATEPESKPRYRCDPPLSPALLHAACRFRCSVGARVLSSQDHAETQRLDGHKDKNQEVSPVGDGHLAGGCC